MEMKFHQHPNTHIGLVSLKVADLNNSLKFYKDIIGFAVIEQAEGKALLGPQGGKPLLALEQPGHVAPKQPHRTGLYHFALLLPERRDLGKVLRHLLEVQYPIGAADHLVSEAIYLDDPDGNGIEIYSDRLSSGWHWNNGEVEMATNQLDAGGLIAEAGNENWGGLPQVTIMGHIHLHVADLQKAKRFYGEGLGLNLVSRYPQAIFMSAGGYHHHLGLNTWNGEDVPAPSPESAGLRQFELVMAGEKERDEAVEKLRKMGVQVNGEFITQDPSGNQIHLAFSE